MDTKPIICTLAEYSRQHNKPTGVLYEIRSCFDTSQFNKFFDWKNFYAVPDSDTSKKLFTQEQVVTFVKSITPR